MPLFVEKEHHRTSDNAVFLEYEKKIKEKSIKIFSRH